jgi:hypothetical protein
MAGVILYKHQKKNLFYQDVTDCEGRFTLRKIYHVSRVVVRILLEVLATVTLVLPRTREKGPERRLLASPASPKLIFALFHCS